MRRSPTDAERLWQLLRALKPLGTHFRRQAPIGNYVADFAWYDGKLVIELDGSPHVDIRSDYDRRRTVWLEAQGYRVLRFWNNDVLKTPRSVGEAILAAAQTKNPTPDPSPQGGGERAAASGEGFAVTDAGSPRAPGTATTAPRNPTPAPPQKGGEYAAAGDKDLP